MVTVTLLTSLLVFRWLVCRLGLLYCATGLVLLLCFNCTLFAWVWCLVWYARLVVLAVNSVDF